MPKTKYQRRLHTLESRSEQFAPEFDYEGWLENRIGSDPRYQAVKSELVELTGLQVAEFHRIPTLDRLQQLPNWKYLWSRYNDYLDLLLQDAFPDELTAPYLDVQEWETHLDRSRG